MEYLLKRGEQQYGPYSLAEMQEYTQAGLIIPTDLARSEGLMDWLPVPQILGNIPIPVVAVPVSIALPVETVPLPPNLHWAILLVIIIISLFLVFLGAAFILGAAFNWIWSLILANWARRLNGGIIPLILFAICPAGFVAGFIIVTIGLEDRTYGFAAIGYALILAGYLAYITGILKIKGAMEDYYNTKENIHLQLSGVVTFFFSLIYIQYHINRIAKWENTGVLE